MKWRLTAGVLVVLAGAACSADRSAPAEAGSEPRHGGTVVVAVPVDIDAANPLVSQLGVPRDFLRNALFLPLVRYGTDLEIEPALSRSWQLTGDTGVVFMLRDDVSWHDGVRTTAFDVKFTFDRGTDPVTMYPGVGELAYITGAEVIDSFTIRFSWQSHGDPLAAFPHFPIVPQHMLDSVAPDAMARASFNHAPVGNGPFRFVAFRPNERWEFEANPDFPEELGGPPNIDRLFWRVIPEAATRIVELRTGGADLILSVSADAYPELAADEQLRGVIRESRNYAMIGWNARRPPLDDPDVRRALVTAIDRQRMVDALRSGIGTLASGPIGPYHWAFSDTVRPPPFDPDEARSLLAGAGIEDRDGNGTLEMPDGQPFSFVLDFPAEQTFMRDMAEIIANDLGEIGVGVQLESLDFNTLIGRLTSPARDYSAVVMGWESDFRVNLRDLFHSAALSGPYQIAGYTNPEVDALIDSVATVIDRSAALPMYHRLQTIMRDEQPWGFLYYFPDLNVARARLNGLSMDVRGAFVDVGKWWVTDPDAVRQ